MFWAVWEKLRLWGRWGFRGVARVLDNLGFRGFRQLTVEQFRV